MKYKKLKYLGIALTFWLLIGSCFQFRSSDRKQLKELKQTSKLFYVDIGTKLAEGRNIHFTQVGKDSTKPTVVFIHGSPGSSSNFMQYAKDTAMLNHFNVLLIDRPGFGYSDFGKSEPSISRQAKMLSSVVSQFNNQRCILVGHSLGGPIICKMAMDDSEIADGLLIIAGSVAPDLEPVEKWRKPMSKKWLSWLMPKSFRVSNEEIIPVKEELTKMETLWDKITIDVKIIQGGRDKLVPSGNEDYAEKKLINARSVEIFRYPKENHFIPFTEPHLVIEALRRF
ncbi:MAG: alpha/beta hydrolase [Bacteroidia bacterium]|nr:alpha/beta hydrolase [Bacteroidia bacterium]NNJ55084.1 alpha/beta hydrolase [Bacteroidia bacterium]